MIDKEFLKKVNILYVEDDDVAREKLGKILQRLFGEVHLANNGIDGFLAFQKLLMNKTPVDLIISDINMPKMSGIEMLEQIREIDKNVPFIFTTARSESENLLRAIELKVNHYVLKPVDIEDIILKSQELCQKIYYEKLLTLKNQEVKEYLSALENIALVAKLDNEGKIKYINEAFLDELGFEEKEVENFFELIHQDNQKALSEKIKIYFLKNKTFKDTIKFQGKNDPAYINTTLFKIGNEEENEYISIGFSNTKESLEKREFRKKVLKNIQEQNTQQFQTKQEIEELKLKLVRYEKALKFQQNEMESLKKRNQIKLQQIAHFENELLNVDEKQDNILKLKNKQVEEYKTVMNEAKNQKELFIKKVQEQEEDILAKRLELEKKEQTIEVKNRRIEDLEDIIRHRESQLKKLDPELLN